MKRILLALLFAASAAADVRYHIRCTEVSGAKSRVLYEANVDGASDFDIAIRDERFTMNAFFVAEGNGPVDLRVRIETRRRHGTSSRGLPLWEEDRQQHRFRVAIDQPLELLPFGKAGPRGLLRLEITPRRPNANAPVRIDIANNTRGDAIAVHAYRVPHWYRVRARLEANGSVVANAVARIFAREPARLALGNAQLVVTAEPAPYRDAWSATLVRFDAPFARGWEGITSGQPLRYTVKGPRGEAWTLVLEVQP